MSRSRRVVSLLLVLVAPGCTGDRPLPDPDALRQPTGLAVAPDGRWLFVTNGNWDMVEAGGNLVAIDLVRLEQALAGSVEGCSQSDEGLATCDASRFIDESASVQLGSGVGNVAVDAPTGVQGPWRLLVPQREPAALAWIDVVPGERLVVDCGQDELRRCDDAHRIRALASDPSVVLPADPARVELDRGGFRFAYLPHLAGGGLSLIALDGEFGPELTDVESDFYRPDPHGDLDLAGGFAVAQRACSLEADNAPRASRECLRPYLYGSQRFWPGLRSFTVAPGVDVIAPGSETALVDQNLDTVQARPYMGGLAFEDPERGEQLLAVHTTPPALTRVDTSLDDQDNPRNQVRATVSLCDDPNHVVVDRPAGAIARALVSCYGTGEVAVVELGSFRVTHTIEVGAGANELAIDAGRRWLFVASTRTDWIAIVGLDPARPGHLRAFARVGANPDRDP